MGHVGERSRSAPAIHVDRASAAAPAWPSYAKVVYTPSNVVINHLYPIDLNHDGLTDLTIETYWQSSGLPGPERKDSQVRSSSSQQANEGC